MNQPKCSFARPSFLDSTSSTKPTSKRQKPRPKPSTKIIQGQVSRYFNASITFAHTQRARNMSLIEFGGFLGEY